MNVLTIEKMTRNERLRVMEEQWKSLSKDGSFLESPQWHGEALRETQSRYEQGTEQPVDWEAAKHDLRKRAE